MKARILTSILLLLLSCIRTESVWAGTPDGFLWGSPEYIHYDAEKHEWVNENTALELIFRLMDRDLGYRKHTLPEHVPEKKKAKFFFDVTLLWKRNEQNQQMQMAMAGMLFAPKRRLVLVNSEPTFNPNVCSKTQYQIWPHLGLLYVGTAAHNEGWDVVIHDELVQGFADIEKLVQPGDIVGFSMVATGVERGVELARQAKRLGARYCIAGNDSAIFRARELLRLPDHPVDAVFTGNSLTAVREFLRHVGTSSIDSLQVPGVAIVPPDMNRSNERDMLIAEREMRKQLTSRGAFDPQDVFIVPRFDLYTDEYWQTVWENYRQVFGHKHIDPTCVRNALALFAQGCTRTGMTDVCSYCTIAGVADLRMPTEEYLTEMLEAYQSFGINYVFNTTDSAFEMRRVAQDLHRLGARFSEGLVLYGRAWGLAHHPEFIEDWLKLTGGRLLINCGMDSGDARILDRGIVKASRSGSRLEENHQAILNVRGSGAHLHYSLIFGSPGETRETCEESLAFFEWTRTVLGSQLDQCEADIFWLNHGAPASRVFHDYSYAQGLAALAGKEISRETWEQCFHRHRDTLAVPWECEEAWFDCFTSITVEEAQAYTTRLVNTMSGHADAAPSRTGAFKPG